MTLNNLAVGVAAGVVGVSAVTASLYALVISVLTMWIGHRIGLLWHGSSNRRREKDTIGTSSSTLLYLSILLYSLLIMQSVYDAVTAGSS
jgi:putative Mn2+ efflux pump MntP